LENKLVVLLLFILIAIIVFIVERTKVKRLKNQNEILQTKIKFLEKEKQKEINDLLHKLEQANLFEAERAKTEEKNKKLWQMSEAVHLQKKLVDEENEKLNEEKKTLELEKKKLDDKVKRLWQQSISIHQEKEKINLIKLEVEEKHQSVKDSIEYAKVIQDSILPATKEIDKYVSDYFILYQPKDVVSGDFYWFYGIDQHSYLIAACDCTGHGVPGAFMSMIGNTLLNEIVKEKKIYSPENILIQLNNNIRITLKQNELFSESRDGMDIALCLVNTLTKKVCFAGANRPLWILTQDENGNPKIKETKANKYAIGGLQNEAEKIFTLHEFELSKGDIFYIFTDGYADQFGGERGKKFMTGNLLSYIEKIGIENTETQKELLKQTIHQWKGELEQVDDICVIGVRV
jgi:serine phosphatase RsbU (regulator of sigma subunit)